MTEVQATGQSMRQVAINWVSPNYFNTLGIDIVLGRPLEDGDLSNGKAGTPVVVSERLAQAVWPREVPLGKALQNQDGGLFEVVGVARDISSTKLGGMDDPMIWRLRSRSSGPLRFNLGGMS